MTHTERREVELPGGGAEPGGGAGPGGMQPGGVNLYLMGAESPNIWGEKKSKGIKDKWHFL